MSPNLDPWLKFGNLIIKLIKPFLRMAARTADQKGSFVEPKTTVTDIKISSLINKFYG
jgi:hypothetical protein